MCWLLSEDAATNKCPSSVTIMNFSKREKIGKSIDLSLFYSYCCTAAHTISFLLYQHDLRGASCLITDKVLRVCERACVYVCECVYDYLSPTLSLHTETETEKQEEREERGKLQDYSR